MAMFRFVLFISLLMGSIMKSATTDNNLRLYDSFAEVHQVYNGPVRFRQSDWDNIKHESIILRLAIDNQNTSITFERRITRIHLNMTGKIIFVRKYPEQKHQISCEMIREYDEYSIVRDMETGRYFRIQSNLIEYPQEPQSYPIYEVSFHPVPTNLSLIVTYVVNNLRWHARYSLQIFANGQTHFQILADIINSSPLLYHFNQTTLMSGDVNLAFGNGKSSSLIAPSITPSTNSIDYSGIYLFSLINGSLTIQPYSTLTLPIILPNICVKVMFTYTLILTIPLSKSSSATAVVSGRHKFQRLYQLSNSSSILPAGHLLLYDSSSNILSGEWNLPTLAESEKYEFELGQDPDIILIYNRTISADRTTNSSLIITNVLIQNYKQQKINIRFKSLCQLPMTCLFYDNKARSLGPRLRYDPIIEAKSEAAFTFTAARLS